MAIIHKLANWGLHHKRGNINQPRTSSCQCWQLDISSAWGLQCQLIYLWHHMGPIDFSHCFGWKVTHGKSKWITASKSRKSALKQCSTWHTQTCRPAWPAPTCRLTQQLHRQGAQNSVGKVYMQETWGIEISEDSVCYPAAQQKAFFENYFCRGLRMTSNLTGMTSKWWVQNVLAITSRRKMRSHTDSKA